MKIDPALIKFFDGLDGYCSAKPFGGDREHERAVDHHWEMSESGLLFCCQCGASGYLIRELLPSSGQAYDA